MKSTLLLVALVTLTNMGCASSQGGTPKVPPVSLPIYPTTDTVVMPRQSEVPMITVETAPLYEEPCGHQLSVHVGKLDVTLPKDGLEVLGVKGMGKNTHVVLEHVTYIKTDYCLRPISSLSKR